MIENVSETRYDSIAQQGRKSLSKYRERAMAEKEASRETLEGGAKLYKDSAPGIGIVLEFPNGRKKYYMTSEQAKEFWFRDYRKDFGI